MRTPRAAVGYPSVPAGAVCVVLITIMSMLLSCSAGTKSPPRPRPLYILVLGHNATWAEKPVYDEIRDRAIEDESNLIVVGGDPLSDHQAEFAPKGDNDLERKENIATETEQLDKAVRSKFDSTVAIPAVDLMRRAVDIAEPDSSAPVYLVVIGNPRRLTEEIDLTDPIRIQSIEANVEGIVESGLLAGIKSWKFHFIVRPPDGLGSEDDALVKETWRRILGKSGARLVFWGGSLTGNFPRNKEVEAVSLRPCTPTYTLGSDLLFDHEKADLNTEASTSIRRMVDQVSNSARIVRIEVRGYTDSTGDGHFDNLGLSERRADVVATLLRTLTSVTVSAKGFGSNNPIASNETEEGRALNRRVEVHFTLSCVGDSPASESSP